MTGTLRDPLTLDELLNYRLMRLFSLSGAPVVRLLEGRYGISRRQWGLLGLLAARGTCSPSELADLMHLDRPPVSRSLASLAAMGLVQRQSEAGDRRRARMVLTAEGQALYTEIFPQVAAFNRRVVEVLDDAAVEALDQALSAMTAQAQQVSGDLAGPLRADRRAGGTRRVRRRAAGLAGPSDFMPT